MSEWSEVLADRLRSQQQEIDARNGKVLFDEQRINAEAPVMWSGLVDLLHKKDMEVTKALGRQMVRIDNEKRNIAKVTRTDKAVHFTMTFDPRRNVITYHGLIAPRQEVTFAVVEGCRKVQFMDGERPLSAEEIAEEAIEAIITA